MSMEKWMESSRESNQDTLAISDKILKFVEDARGQVTVTDVAIRTRISPQQAQTHLNALAQLTPCDFTVSEHGEMVFNFLEVIGNDALAMGRGGLTVPEEEPETLFRPLAPDEWYSRYAVTGRADFVEDYPDGMAALMRRSSSLTSLRSQLAERSSKMSIKQSHDRLPSGLVEPGTVLMALPAFSALNLIIMALMFAVVGDAHYDTSIKSLQALGEVPPDSQLVYFSFDHVGSWW